MSAARRRLPDERGTSSGGGRALMAEGARSLDKRATLGGERATLRDERATLKDERATLKDERATLKDERARAPALSRHRRTENDFTPLERIGAPSFEDHRRQTPRHLVDRSSTAR